MASVFSYQAKETLVQVGKNGEVLRKETDPTEVPPNALRTLPARSLLS
jgi:hypothetical protein